MMQKVYLPDKRQNLRILANTRMQVDLEDLPDIMVSVHS